MEALRLELPEPVPQKSGKKSGKARLLLWIAASWSLAAGWVALTPPFSEPFRPLGRTRQQLGTVGVALRAYVGKYKTTPPDLAALRTFARFRGLPLGLYDPFGQRFDYLRLDDEHYLVRSFGADGLQTNEQSSPDAGIVNWGPRPAEGLRYRMARTLEQGFYPAPLLAGLDSPDQRWHARLYVDRVNQKRQLLVRHLTKPGTFMAAHHDAIEEFLWLPDGKRLVYTASGSTRHRDGLYVWDLDQDTTINLVDGAKGLQPMSPTARADGLWLSLAGMSLEGPTVYAYWGARHEGALDPEEFFHPSRLVGFKLPPGIGDQGRARAVPPPSTMPFAREEALQKQLVLGQQIEGSGGLKLQKAWLALPVAGELEAVLTAWQRYSERENQSPLFPYCLWILSGLYGESFQVMVNHDPRAADVLRTYGTEIARALLNDPLAPTYLRGLAHFTYQSLMAGKPLPYRFARLSVTGTVEPWFRLPKP